MYDDELWAQVYPGMTCGQAVTKWTPDNAGFGTIAMPPAPPGPQGIQVSQPSRPHMWYFTMAIAPGCTQNVELTSYTLELLQADGNQLGYDEIGMPAIYGVFWAIYMVIVLGHVYVHYYRSPRFAPVMVRWFTASLVCINLSYFCKMIDWTTASSNGIGVPAMSTIGDIFRLLSLMTLWTVCAMAALGYGIVTYKLDEKNYNWVGWLLLVAILCGYITLIIYFSIDIDPRNPTSFGSVWPAITLLLVTLMYAAWWIWKIRMTYASEVNMTKKALIRHLGFSLLGNFFVLPFAYIVGSATPIYERTRVTAGLDIFVILCINLATTWSFWPSNAQDAFRVYDGTAAAAMLGSDIVDGTEFHSALDEAYSYTGITDHSSREYSGAL